MFASRNRRNTCVFPLLLRCYHTQHCFFLIEVQLIYHIILVSGVTQYNGDAIFLQIIFHLKLSQNSGYIFLCCTIYPGCLFIFQIVVCLYASFPLSFSSLFPSSHYKHSFLSISLFLFCHIHSLNSVLDFTHDLQQSIFH